MAGADVVLLGHVVKFDPGAALAVHDALGPQDLAVLSGVQRGQDALNVGLGEGLGRLLAPAGEDLIGVVMVMVAGAVGIVALVIVVVVVIMLLLTMLPQAILLSATGGLMHSSFVHSLVPVACFTFTAMSVTYGVTVGRLHGLADIFGAMVSGFNKAGVFFVFYILIAGLYRSVVFVFIF